MFLCKPEIAGGGYNLSVGLNFTGGAENCCFLLFIKKMYFLIFKSPLLFSPIETFDLKSLSRKTGCFSETPPWRRYAA